MFKGFTKHRHIELSGSLERLPNPQPPHFTVEETGPKSGHDLLKVTPWVSCRDGKPGIPILVSFFLLVFSQSVICTTTCKILFLGLKDNFSYAQLKYYITEADHSFSLRSLSIFLIMSRIVYLLLFCL